MSALHRRDGCSLFGGDFRWRGFRRRSSICTSANLSSALRGVRPGGVRMHWSCRLRYASAPGPMGVDALPARNSGTPPIHC